VHERPKAGQHSEQNRDGPPRHETVPFNQVGVAPEAECAVLEI